MPAVSKKQQRFFGYLLSNPEERKKKGISKKAAKDFAQDIQEVSPPGWGHTKAEKEKTKPWKPKSKIGGTAAAFKRALDDGRFKGLPGSRTKKEKTADMFKIMWAQKKKGAKPHYKPGTDEKYKKYLEEETSIAGSEDWKKKNKKAIAYRYKTLHKGDTSGDVNEALSAKDSKKLNKASVLSYSDDPKDQHRARVRQAEIDFKDLMRQRAKKKKSVKESFEIDTSAHKKAQKKAKLRNLAKGNTNPNEKAAAEKKAGGPKLIGERLGGKGYKPYTSLTGKKVSGDWEDSDRGAGNKAKKRAGGKVEKKSPTYLAHVHNKEEKEYEDEAPGTPSSVEEAKVDKGRSDYGKATIRNWRHSGPSTVEPAMFDPDNKRGKTIDKRREEHKARRGVKGAKVPTYQKEEVVTETKDKKGKGSGTKDACYHKVKASAKVWPSAYASGRLVQCRKKGAANYGKSKSEGFEGWADKAILEKTAAWTRKEGKNKEGGLNEKGRKSYEKANPGSDLKAPQPEGGSRKKSFCARMGGMKKKLTSAKTANDPDSRINKALRKWKC